MKPVGSVRTPHLVLRASLVLVSLVAGASAAQTCPTGTAIPSFRFVSSTQTLPRQVTYAWGAPAGAAAGTTYQVLRSISVDYCTSFAGYAVIAETTDLTATVSLDTPDRVYEFWVRVKGCDARTPVVWIDDSFVTPPSPATLEVSGVVAGQVTLTLTENDSISAGQVIERAGEDGVSREIETRFFYDFCPAGSAHPIVDSGLPSGTYSYRAWSFNQGRFQQVFSNVVTVTVGGTGGAAPVIAFYSASPASVNAGQTSTLSWSTTGATDASIDQSVGSVLISGSVAVHPMITTTYTLTVTGPGGTSTGRVQVTVAPDALEGGVAGTVVTVVSAPGLNGAYYRTAVQVSNPSTGLSFGRLVFHPKERSGSVGDSFVRYALQPLQTLEFGDVLALVGTSGNGSLDVVPEGGAVPLVRARVYNDAGRLGTMGVTEDALPPGDALNPGDTALLLAPSDPRRFRFSIGLRTLTAGATLTFTLRDSRGTFITSFTESYPGTFYVQKSASDFFRLASFTGNESITIDVSAGSAFVYATVADNVTNDPSIQIARRLP